MAEFEMPVINRSTPNVLDASSESYIRPMVEFLTEEPRISKGVKARLRGGSIVEFDGKTYDLKRGLVETEFLPKRGRVNLTTTVPEMPVVTAPEATPVPSRIGMRINFGIGIAGLAAWIEANKNELAEAVEDIFAREKMQEDFDLSDDTLTAAQIEPEALANRIQAASMTKTANKTSSPRRIKIHGWSKK
jgi:hypothetical protein